MTVNGLERVGKSKTEEDRDEENTIDKYKKSKEELKKEYERKKKEADDLKKELDNPADTTKYHYQKAVSFNHPALPPAKSIGHHKAEPKEYNDIASEASIILFREMI